MKFIVSKLELNSCNETPGITLQERFLVDRTKATLEALNRIMCLSDQHLDDAARAVGVTPVQLRLLKLAQDVSCSTAKFLADQMGVSQATMTALLDRLEMRGLIERRVSDADRRQKRILLTDIGHHAIRMAPDPTQQNYHDALSLLQDWERAMLLAAFERFADALEQVTTKPDVDQMFELKEGAVAHDQPPTAINPKID